MSPIDIDDLRGRWQAHNHMIGKKLDLDAEAFARLLASRTRTSVNRRRRSLLWTTGLSALATLALISFAIIVPGLQYWASALVLAMFTGAAVVQGMLEHRTLGLLRLDGPPTEALDTVRRLRAREWAMTRAIVSCSVLAWWPFLLVLFRSFGFDLSGTVDPSVPLVHVALGLVILPVVWLIFRMIETKSHGAETPEFALDSGGDALLDLQWRLMAEHRQQIDPAAAEPIPESWRAVHRSDRRRLLAGVLFCIGLMLANGLHMAASGGQWLVIATGIILQLGTVAWMINSLTHWHQMGQVTQYAVAKADWRRHVDRIKATQQVTIPLLVTIMPAVSGAGLISWMSLGLAAALVTMGVALLGSIFLAYGNAWRRSTKLRRTLGTFARFGASRMLE